jgi:hypothetical protein
LTKVEKDAFKEKLKSLHFGMIPGGYRSDTSSTYYDESALPPLPTKEEALDHASDMNRVEPELRTFWAKDDAIS